MSDAIIQIEKLGKSYRIGQRLRYLALRDVLTETFSAPFRRRSEPGEAENSQSQSSNGFIWALREITFDIAAGERLGIIGRNGAGKSTLLKILARVTCPTEGRAELRGRVGSLLEVGTGFHPELTGRENLFLSGAILGMRRAEIERKFDEIVGFAGVERFIDTPLKHYSTGMQLRLAFAVAAHLEPEILLVDEVLAVGDLEFQKKCLGKMEDVSRGGRTVVFVSHQMNQMRRLCQRIVWLEGGRVRLSGPATEVIAAYEEAMTSGGAAARKESAAGARARFHQWAIVEPRGEQPHILEMLGPVRVKFRAQLASPAQMVHLGVTLYNLDNQMIWGWGAFNLEIAAGEQEFSFTFPMLPLRPGVYTWQIGLWDEEGCLDCWNALPNLIVATPNYQHRDDQWSGILNVPCEFQMAAGEQSP